MGDVARKQERTGLTLSIEGSYSNKEAQTGAVVELIAARQTSAFWKARI